MKTKLKSLLALALCAVGLSAFAEPDAVQLWEDGPYWATSNLGTPETHDPAYPAEYGALYTFDNATNEVAKLGDGWRVPSDVELKMLDGENDGDKVCSNVWTTCNGVAGCRFFGMTSGYEDKSIFLPAAGYDLDDGRKNAGDRGYYWSSAEMVADYFVWLLRFDEEHDAHLSFDNPSHGLSVRAVRDTPPTPTPPEPSDEEVVATAEATFVLGPALAVKNVRTATHWPWDGKIDVTCDLTGTGTVQLEAALTTNGVKVCDATAANLTGATTINLDAAGGVTNGVKFVWNAKADCPAGFNSKDTKVKVTAKKVPPPPAGALPGVFSVSADKKVLFSQGNLVATIDVSGVPTAWKFAANQYDCIGNATANNSIGSTAGDVDLFGWSTATTAYGINTSNNDNKYSGEFVDWGTAIDNKGTWCTLSKDEWVYLFETRPMANGGARYENVTSSIMVGGVKFKGAVLFPDNFTEQATWKERYTTWEALNNAGLVFLPAGGYRFGLNVVSVGSVGYYWTSFASGSSKAYRVSIKDAVILDSQSRHMGCNVRLVTEVK